MGTWTRMEGEAMGDIVGYTESRVGMVAHFSSGRPVRPAWFQLLLRVIVRIQ